MFTGYYLNFEAGNGGGSIIDRRIYGPDGVTDHQLDEGGYVVGPRG